MTICNKCQKNLSEVKLCYSFDCSQLNQAVFNKQSTVVSNVITFENIQELEDLAAFLKLDEIDKLYEEELNYQEKLCEIY